MNLEEYFKRIGFHGPFSKPDLETLNQVHKHHVMSIPFENLSIHCGEKITMDHELIFNKIVRSNWGGWCCENNLLFAWVLKEMCYNPVTLGSRVYNNTINQIFIDWTAYIADVSFGVSSQIWYPLELVSGKDQPQSPDVFHLIQDGDLWKLEKTGRKPLVLNEAFTNSPLVHKKTSHCLQTDPKSLFTNKSICSLQTATGFRALIGWTFSEVTYNNQDGFDVFDMKDTSVDDLITFLLISLRGGSTLTCTK
uniref:arylamine N-acetyltransferase n=1 Tax=Oncorhynchus kisutch TaxID=8019 RepID=A0A8C7GF44_ONCKI